MPSFLLALLLFPSVLLPPAANRSGPAIEPHPASFLFGREMTFTASVHSAEALVHAQLLLRNEFSAAVSYPAVITAEDGFTLTVRRNLQEEPLFPFARVTYWWEAELSGGQKIVSGLQTVLYSDDRFAWSQFTRNNISVAWVEGESRVAEDAAELIRLTLGTASVDLDTPIPDPISLYIYPRLADFHYGLGNRIHGWEGAVSDPASGVILLAAASGAEGRRPMAVLVPHEVIHILLGTRWKDAYPDLPLWLVEGLAAAYEMESRPEADAVLRSAAASGGLIPVQALCRVFPAEESPALLAYAESKSFVKFLKDGYGLAAVRHALAAYAEGAECEMGLESSTGKTIRELERNWVDGLSPTTAWISPAWILVLAVTAVLAGVMIVRWLIHNKNIVFPGARKDLE